MTAERHSGSFVGHAATYAVGNIARRLAGFVMLPIYTRYLSPGDYGAVGLLTFALALLEPFFGARLASAVPKFYFDAPDGRLRRAVIWSAIILTGSVSVITTLAIVLLRHPASEILFGSQKYAVATGFFAINMLSQPLEYTGMTYLRLQERSRLFLGISIGKMVLQILLNFLLVVHYKLTVVGVVLSGIISSLALGIGLTLYVAVHNRPAFDWTTTCRMLKFCWPIWFAGLAGLYVGSSGALYVRVFDSLSDVGLLELGLKFANTVALLIWTPFFQHWEPASYRYYAEGTGRDRFQVAFVALSAILLTAGLGVSIFSEPVIHVMAAPPFHAAARTVPILTLGFILNSLVSFFYFSFFVTSRTKLYGVSQYITAALLTIVYWLLIPKFGLQGAVWGQCLAFGINFVFVYLWSRRYFDAGFDLAPVCFMLLIVAVGYACSNMLFAVKNVVVDLLLKGAILAAAGAVVVLIGLRAIRSASPTAYASIRLSLHRFGIGRLARGEAAGQ